jgi:hypothetical protein
VVVDMRGAPLAASAVALHDDVVSCWMCGIRQYANQMLADGGAACDDIRWYCTDPQACTERWITARHQTRTAGTVPPGSASAAPRAQRA